MPSHEAIKKHPSLGILGSAIEDPNLFHLNRYSVSMAFLVGIFLAFFPVPGQMVLAALVAFWVRCNLPLAVALVWITNPITIPFIFFSTYKLGTWLLDTPAMDLNASFSWEWINNELSRIWKPLLIGSLCAGSFFSITSYTAIKLLWRWRVTYAWHHRKERRKKKEAKSTSHSIDKNDSTET